MSLTRGHLECDDLYSRLCTRDISRAETLRLRKELADHHEEISELRRFYMRDIVRAGEDETVQTIIFDGSDTNACHCPHRWRQEVNGEALENTYIDQKMQTVLLHHKKLFFFMSPPYVRRGANLTASTLLHVLPYISPKVRTLRIQHDGKDERRIEP